MELIRGVCNVAGIVWVLAVGLLGGCEWKGGLLPGETPTSQPADSWNTAPVAIRVYPATRFIPDSSRTVLEARLEMLDALDDSAKGVGNIRFELRATTSGQKTSVTDRLYAWDVAIRTLEEQKRFYDPVTRTYLFRLSMDEVSQLPAKVSLHVQFTPEKGERIETDAMLHVPKPVE